MNLAVEEEANLMKATHFLIFDREENLVNFRTSL